MEQKAEFPPAIQNLPLTKYRIYRASQPINASDITDGNYTHFSEVNACLPEQDAFSCLDQERSTTFLTLIHLTVLTTMLSLLFFLVV